ncbi:Valine--tRNA ligase [Lamellibrachia satsuma]|nr:Valine--tRNA ligase [Lamellibrachia satsuma]
MHTSALRGSGDVKIKTEQVLSGEEKRRLIKQKKDAKREARLERLRQKEANSNKQQTKETVLYDISTPPGAKKDTTCPLPAAYSPRYVEAAWYAWWEKAGFFTPEYYKNHGRESSGRFVLCLPPPNVTGSLHLGHALGNSIEDAIVRWHRMCGRSVLWNPGCDHAGIATQVVVEKKLWREKQRTRHDLGRDKFIEEVWQWKNEKGSRIYGQMKQLGSSLDWSRACFTLDPKLSHAVNEAFVRLHEAGLIYRSSRLVNWSCALKSAISDIEVDDLPLTGRTLVDVPGHNKKVPFGILTSFAYQIEDSDREIVVSTTRPETMLGDMAIAVHPDDHRYGNLYGQFARHPFCDRRLPIICDEFVDPKFGTGAVKITPGHDSKDYDVGRRHSLNIINILGDDGTMTNVPAPFQGQKRFEARTTVVEALKVKGLFRGEEDNPMVIPICSRSKDVIEPRIKEQWYVKCDDMARKAIEAVQTKRLTLMPDTYEKQWFDWLENIRDWCISRQLWWGHRIPAYQVKRKDGQPLGEQNWVSAHNYEEALQKACKKYGLTKEQLALQQDEDVLDTWFSSAIFPFSIFGWPEQTSDLHEFYPTDLLETASDIMFFWVARMVMLGDVLTGTLPFNQVLFHSILRDAHGRKMSKSLGNVIDPMDVIHGISLENLQKQLENSNLDPKEVNKAKQGQKKDFPLGITECGTDALRFTMCSYNYKAHFVNIDVSHVKNNRHFCNKIWQAFKFASGHLGPEFQPPVQPERTDGETATDRWILSRVAALVAECDDGFRSYNLNSVTQALYTFWWAELCDVYLEYCKPVFADGATADVQRTRNILFTCLDVGLRCLSPFMPYLTEELFQRLPQRGTAKAESICVADYPQIAQFDWRDHAVETDMGTVRDVVGQCLSLRKDFNLTKAKANVFIEGATNSVTQALVDHLAVVKTLSRSNSVTLVSCDNMVALPSGCVDIDMEGICHVHICLKGLIDEASEVKRLTAQREKLQGEQDWMLKRMAGTDEATVPEHIRLAEQEKFSLLESHLKRVARALDSLERLKQQHN